MTEFKLIDEGSLDEMMNDFRSEVMQVMAIKEGDEANKTLTAYKATLSFYYNIKANLKAIPKDIAKGINPAALKANPQIPIHPFDFSLIDDVVSNDSEQNEKLNQPVPEIEHLLSIISQHNIAKAITGLTAELDILKERARGGLASNEEGILFAITTGQLLAYQQIKQQLKRLPAHVANYLITTGEYSTYIQDITGDITLN
jgi:hypothetical protein